MTLKNDYKGVAAAGGGRITGSVKYFKSRPEDIGAMVHETVHCVQSYRTRGNPGWLVEGIADYVRFFKYEPGKLGKIKNDAHYDGSYRTSAAFLNFVAEKYDPQLVRKVNKAMREGEYREEIWKTLTKKSIKELDDEWRASMKKGAATTGLRSEGHFVLAQDKPKKAPAPAKEITGSPSLLTYPVPGGNADALAKLLQDVFPPPKTRITALGMHQIAVWAEPQVHLTIAQQRPLQPPVLTQIPLARQDVNEIAKKLKAMFGESRTGGPFIDTDADTNSIRVRRAPEHVDEVKQAVRLFDEGAA